MAKYTVTHTCGHTQEVNLFGENEEWTQDVDNRDGGADSLKQSFKDGQLSVMSFFSEKSGYMDIMVWEA